MLLVNRKIVRVVLLWIEGGEWNGFLQAEDKLASDPALGIQFSLVGNVGADAEGSPIEVSSRSPGGLGFR